MPSSTTKVANRATSVLPDRPKVLPRLSEVDLKNLRIFKTVAELFGVSAAAHHLGMEKSNVSRAIAHLEGRLGEILCSRGPKGFELTSFGKSVYASAIRLNDAMEVARSEMMRARNALTGVMRIGMPDNCQANEECYVSDVLAQMTSRMPEVELHLHIMSSETLREALTERRVHLAINSVRMPASRFDNEMIFNERFRLYIKLRKGEVAPHLAQLRSRGVSLVLREDEALSREWSSALHHLRDRKLYASGLEAVAILMDSGPFAGFLPTHFARQLSGIMNLHEIRGCEELRYEFPFYLTYERERPQIFALSSLISMFLAHPRRNGGVGTA